MRQWKDYKAIIPESRLDKELKHHFELSKMKKRGVSSNASRLRKSEMFNSLQVPSGNDIPNKIQGYGIRFASFKTPNKYEGFSRKRMSSFNENKRRPVNTLTIPRQGDNNSGSESMSSVRSEENKLTYFPKSNFKTPQVHSSSPSMNSNRDSQSKRGIKLSSKKLGNLECKESHNFGEVGESIINKGQRSRRKHKTKAIYPTHLRLIDNLNFDQSEYDDEQMNEKVNDKLKTQNKLPNNIVVRLDYPSKIEQNIISKSMSKLYEE